MKFNAIALGLSDYQKVASFPWESQQFQTINQQFVQQHSKNFRIINDRLIRLAFAILSSGSLKFGGEASSTVDHEMSSELPIITVNINVMRRKVSSLELGLVV